MKRLKYHWFTKILPAWNSFRRRLRFIPITQIVFSTLILSVWISLILILCASIFWVSELWMLEFNITSKGFQKFISTGDKYKGILTISFSIIGLYLIIIQIRQGNFSNKINLKEKWVKDINTKVKEQLKYSSEESGDTEFLNYEIVRYIEFGADEVFDFLFTYKMKISNRYILRKYFEKFIRQHIIQFEEAAIENISRGFEYSENENIPPSLLHFRKINDYILKPSDGYFNLYNHFDNMYLDAFEEVKYKVGNFQKEKEGQYP